MLARKKEGTLVLAAGAAAVAAYVVWRRMKESRVRVRDVVLNTGARMPTVGLGTFQATKPGEVKAAVKAAVKAGYRLLDCAAGYGNQREIGAAIKELESEGVCRREDLFLVSKLFQTHHAGEQAGADGESRCVATLEQTLAELQTEYLDLFLIHWPFGFGETKLEKPPGKRQPLRLKDGAGKGGFNVTSTCEFSDDMCQGTGPFFENSTRDDLSSKNESKRVKTDRDTSLER